MVIILDTSQKSLNIINMNDCQLYDDEKENLICEHVKLALHVVRASYTDIEPTRHFLVYFYI